MNESTVETEFWSIELVSNEGCEDDTRGLTDVRFWLRDSTSGVRGVVTVRVYFTDASMSVEQIKVEAPVAARRILAQINEVNKSDVSIENLERRWK